MTFLELQKQIQQTKKARKGVKNRRDYFKNATFEEEMALEEIYKRALRAANEVLKHYEETGEFDPKEKMCISWTLVKTKADNEIGEYNKKEFYVVSRQKVGRRKRPLTDEEKTEIKIQRQAGRGYNSIAKDLRRGNKVISDFCKENGF